ncbi:hypothetical protein BKP35_16510 [Anaerobacillus arseniciselenatis]|uniref:SAF domain-containing protein n=1 Tax=Anaerobacillus arseniciselenatis TaxID=85682 RepID=A0A1S2LAT9_9BACI|nr:SAF domain-containing protein [Anaerobacillus arseniciselenatis]OIJ09456.1 hypothetical protein BKP35_16510 [Anaerobacillus arseniciselenatis]
MKKIINKNLLISILFLLIFIGTAIFVITDPFNELNSIQVVLAKEDIEINQMIENDDVYVAVFPKNLFTSEILVQKNKVVGKRANVKISQNSFFTSDMLDMAFLRPTEEHQFFIIPNSWILQLQGSLRRFDKVNIYAVISEKQNEFPLPIISDPILKEIPVIYVKSNNNREVEDVNGVSDRLQGTTRPTQVELSLKSEEFKKLEELYDQGYKFIFSY